MLGDMAARAIENGRARKPGADMLTLSKTATSALVLSSLVSEVITLHNLAFEQSSRFCRHYDLTRIALELSITSHLCRDDADVTDSLTAWAAPNVRRLLTGRTISGGACVPHAVEESYLNAMRLVTRRQHERLLIYSEAYIFGVCGRPGFFSIVNDDDDKESVIDNLVEGFRGLSMYSPLATRMHLAMPIH
ncbi:hypothetical protein A3709_18765 [Halioglobus sp. HI00S01]|nr:hypothetical protein A3709_18765 [Halioglobus sp. HI00S01]